NDNQKVVVDGNGLQIVTVQPVKAPAGVKLGYKGSEPELLEALKPTRFVQSDSKEIIALASEAIGQTQDAGEAAGRIEKFINNYIEEKGFGIGYGSAVEVAQSREGDCSEHAVLTAAMCKAVGIPAQVVSGMVYVDDLEGYRNIFGGHAWTQVYIGDRWVYLDATRPDRSKAGHIALASGSGDPESFLEMVTSIGNFVINEVKVRH
ncbi:MAG: transglutaminase-like domain-containing protein, partial [Planctomycetota bacterium]